MIAANDNPWFSHPVVIDGITPEIAGVDTYHLRLVDAAGGAAMSFLPGQFTMLYLPGCGEIPISISDDPAPRDAARRGVWAHTIRVAGNATRALQRLGVGGSLGMRGPYGSSWPITACAGCDVIMAAGGIGLAPLRSALYRLLAERTRFGRLTLLYGARTPDTLLYTREFADWSRRGLEIETTVDRCEAAWRGTVGAAPLLVERLTGLDPGKTMLLTCGPDVMMHYTIRAALERGLSGKRIWLSMERNMQCAVGLCGHCQLGPAFVCKNGPVFRYDAIEPFLRAPQL